jgi:hypothetical protein
MALSSATVTRTASAASVGSRPSNRAGSHSVTSPLMTKAAAAALDDQALAGDLRADSVSQRRAVVPVAGRDAHQNHPVSVGQTDHLQQQLRVTPLCQGHRVLLSARNAAHDPHQHQTAKSHSPFIVDRAQSIGLRLAAD